MSYTLSDIVHVDKWQKIQDYFSQVLSIYLRTVDLNWQFFTRPSGSSRLCDMLHIFTDRKKVMCNECLLREFEDIEKDWNQGYECVPGVFIYPVPLRVQDKVVAYIIVGPVIVGKPRNYQAFKEVIDTFGIDAEEFLDAIRDTRTFTFNGVNSLLELLYDIGRYVCEVGYTNLRLRKLLPSVPSVFDSLNAVYLDKMLKALLDISYNFLNADRGSIMLLDKSRNELYIATAKNIPQDIVSVARQKIGQGIAGLVAQNLRPMIIDSQSTDPKLRSLLRNPSLTCAISVPLKVKSRLLGVLNIATTKAEPKEFEASSLETIDTLTRLVEETLADIAP
ncbi:MAG: PocR ligand-binding domain-containing protein [Candidatus Omnitrophica bacterium]|nr:PocR ligand-binding domain-containing protein [Candidatus Omnitrophota bacterium]